MTVGRWLRSVGAGLVAVVALLMIVVLATGAVALITAHGRSMEPSFHSGDLAVVVPGSNYHVGEVVGYWSPLLRVVVLHRIVAAHGGTFTFKGDNNPFLDPRRLPASDIRGRLWLHVPDGGTVLGWVRAPAVLGFVACVLIVLGVGGASRHRWGRGPTTAAGSRRAGPKHAAPNRTGQEWWPLVVALAVVCVLAVVTAGTWSMATTRPSVRPLPYVQRMTVTYTATAPVGDAYPTAALSTGDPVFLRLVHTLGIRVHYVVVPGGGPAHPHAAVEGTISATALLDGPAGWSTRLAAVSPEPFSGAQADVDVPIDLTRIATPEKAFVAETGVSLA